MLGQATAAYEHREQHTAHLAEERVVVVWVVVVGGQRKQCRVARPVR